MNIDKTILKRIALGLWLLLFFVTVLELVIFHLKLIEHDPLSGGEPINREALFGTLVAWYVLMALASIAYSLLVAKDSSNFSFAVSFFMFLVALLGIAYSAGILDTIHSKSHSSVKSFDRLLYTTPLLGVISTGLAGYEFSRII